MNMKIVLFHPSRLPPPDYGGTERVTLWLAEGLRERGHSVWIAADPGSVLPEGIGLIEIPPENRSATSLQGRMPAGIDCVHFMAAPRVDEIGFLDCAWMSTIHGNGQPGEVFPKNTVFLSADHAARHGRKSFVHNGLNPREFTFNPVPRQSTNGALFLSRTHWKVKNLRGAMRLCRRAGLGLHIAGGHRPFSLRLLAALWGQKWWGPVSGERKARLFSAAQALVFPILWPEPFGLVIIEALISGTPVLASRLGSLPEILTPDCGRLLPMPDTVEAEAEWIDALARLRTGALKFDPEACRARALSHFTHLKMAENYEGLYRKVIAGETLP